MRYVPQFVRLLSCFLPAGNTNYGFTTNSVDKYDLNPKNNLNRRPNMAYTFSISKFKRN